MNGYRWPGGHLDDEWKSNISKAIKGKKKVWKDPEKLSAQRSEIAKKRGKRLWGINLIPGHKTRGSSGMHWWTNGIDNVLALVCPDGYHKGRIGGNDASK